MDNPNLITIQLPSKTVTTKEYIEWSKNLPDWAKQSWDIWLTDNGIRFCSANDSFFAPWGIQLTFDSAGKNFFIQK